MSYQLLLEFFQKYFVVHEWSAFKKSFSTYVWSKVDSYFCQFLYIRFVYSCLTQMALLVHLSRWNYHPLHLAHYISVALAMALFKQHHQQTQCYVLASEAIEIEAAGGRPTGNHGGWVRYQKSTL